jgi:putative transposase
VQKLRFISDFSIKAALSTMASFRNIYTSLMLVIAGSTQKELARQVSYLKAENGILRSRLPDRISLTQRERNRLVRFAQNLGSALNELASIVHPGTIRRWIRDASRKKSARQNKAGRPRTAEQIEQLILKLASQNGWGYTRILGELKKLGIESITRNTVKNILKRNGFDVGPRRGPGTWDEFLKRHAKTMWQCDFFSKKVVSKTGLRDLFAIAFLHIESRRVFITPSTYNPDETWVLEQADAFKRHIKKEKLPCKLLMHDRDTKFTKTFNEKFSTGKKEVRISAFRSPNTNAFIERFIQSIKQECLDHFVVFGRKHFDHICAEYCEHYNEERPHQGIENATIGERRRETKSKSMPDTIQMSDLRCKERLGGLLKHYSRKAA